ncbi:MAG: hypothetical protein ACRD1X_12710 [Vicinamibacteria bacterium]
MAAHKAPVGKVPAFIRNPLTVVGVFAGLAEVSGAWVLPKLPAEIQGDFVWFVMLFPGLLVVLFFLTLNFNHKCLYAPSDYRADEAFMELIRVKKDVYARADAVSRLASGVARAIAFGLSRGQRLAGPDLDHLLLRERDRLSDTLREAGISDKEIADAVSPVTSIIEFDLASSVATDTVYALRGERKGQQHPQENEAAKRVQKALQHSRPGHEVESVRAYLESLGVWTEKIQAGVQELQHFRETGDLPPLRDDGQEDDE